MDKKVTLQKIDQFLGDNLRFMAVIFLCLFLKWPSFMFMSGMIMLFIGSVFLAA